MGSDASTAIAEDPAVHILLANATVGILKKKGFWVVWGADVNARSRLAGKK